MLTISIYNIETRSNSFGLLYLPSKRFRTPWYQRAFGSDDNLHAIWDILYFYSLGVIYYFLLIIKFESHLDFK